jgi:Anti-sigma-K factor rskA
MTCEQLAPFYEKFALGVLEGMECAEMEAHLARACPKCEAGLRKASRVVEQLNLAAPDAQIQAAPRAKFMEASKTPTGRARAGIPITEPKPAPQHSIFPAWAWIAAAGLALLTGYTIRQMSNQNDQLAQLRKQLKLASMQNQSLQTQLDIDHMAAMIMVSPDSMALKLTPKDKYLPVIRAYLHPHMGMAITAREMPSMPSARTLQLWLLQKSGMPVSAAIFHPDAAGQIALVFPVTVPLNEITALGVSDEPAGGSAQPTTPMSWTAQIH